MKQPIKPIAISLCLLGLITVPVFANAASSNSQQMRMMQQELSELKSEVKTLKSELRSTHGEKKSVANHRAKTTTTTHYVSKNKSQSTSSYGTSTAPIDTSPVSHNERAINGPTAAAEDERGTAYLPYDLDVPGQAFVSTGPYIGIPLEYSGSNLIINSPSVNQDVALLKVRKNINRRLDELGRGGETDHSHLLFSGALEGQAIYKNTGAGSDKSDIDLTNATLDAYILGPSHWISGLISLTYDNDIGANEGTAFTNHRTSNSRVFLNQGFVIIGNFQESPWYGSFGQMYVPFGTYSTNMVSSPVTKLMARTKARAINIGFQQQTPCALYAAVYAFKGDSHVGTQRQVNDGGINVGYRFKFPHDISGDFGAGVIGNIADSVGMQNVGARPFFDGFGGSTVAVTNPTTGLVTLQSTGSETLVHRVPAYDFRGLFSLGTHIDLLAEYITASTSFNPNDLTFNGHGARPRALNAEAVYTFTSFCKPSSVAIGYGMSRDALALGLPLDRYSIVLNTSWWKDTLQSLEFRHDINYAASNTATGSNIQAQPSNGRSDNIVTAQFDLYF